MRTSTLTTQAHHHGLSRASGQAVLVGRRCPVAYRNATGPAEGVATTIGGLGAGATDSNATTAGRIRFRAFVISTTAGRVPQIVSTPGRD